VDSSLGEIRLTNSTHEQGPKEENVRNAVKQIEEEQVALDCSWKLLEELLSKVQEDAVARAANESRTRSTEVKFEDYNSGFQAGTINGPISGISFGAK
jgi:hypothetical protein